jgi:hypothetical protein
VNEKFVKKNNLTTTNTTPIKVELADGSKKQINKTLEIQNLQLGEYQTKGIHAQLIRLQHYDAILKNLGSSMLILLLTGEEICLLLNMRTKL